jgi:hypothetical protein
MAAAQQMSKAGLVDGIGEAAVRGPLFRLQRSIGFGPSPY